jgi:hypothetical protein
LHFFDYTLSDVFNLDPNNRWVKRAKLVPWKLAEAKYSYMFRKNGRPAKDIRMALGALLIKEYLQCSDEETLQSIAEQPYLQHFIGLKKFTNQAPFDASLMVWFRKRLSAKFMSDINEIMCKTVAMPQDEDERHGGTLIVDATCTPANIKYPTDTGLLAEAIEKSDQLIDILQEPLKGVTPRPRTYREKSRKLFTAFVRQRKPGLKTIRKTKGKLLHYLKRNIGHVNNMIEKGGELSFRQRQLLQTIEKLFQQQLEMYEKRTNRVESRIVSICQPHIRPIVRGKAGTPVEFGAKVNMSVAGEYVFLDEISYDSFYEGDKLPEAIKKYHERFGMFPLKILTDKAYGSRENRKICKELGIKLMGKPLGRPPAGTTPEISKNDIGQRNEVEGKFGTLKTNYGWGRIMARLPETGKSIIAIAAVAFNLAKKARVLLGQFFRVPLFCHFGVSTSFSLNVVLFQ